MKLEVNIFSGYLELFPNADGVRLQSLGSSKYSEEDEPRENESSAETDIVEMTTYNSVVHETTEIRVKCKSSGEVKLLKLSIDDLTFSRLRLQMSKSIAKITSALTRRLPGKSSTARRLKGKSSTARRLPNSLAYIRLLQAHRITNGSHPPIIVSFYDSMNHKNFRIKILGFFSSLWRESERYVVFSSQEWKKKKGKSILGALRASNWLFMVVVVLMTMAIL
ncbi:hypothetical protein IGI04_029747 [Brassica rapa subsp. trilocularis]|uniref:Uncharacterized protein n=1 Tax=Brassica rapa subsp. trilocularis TaxID=1813537 RepID=A0ABQ7LSN3_BRACM|nr:hypothetical protein IGI04_029747 [Brassica rapa subsp. trilocularis]